MIQSHPLIQVLMTFFLSKDEANNFVFDMLETYNCDLFYLYNSIDLIVNICEIMLVFKYIFILLPSNKWFSFVCKACLIPICRLSLLRKQFIKLFVCNFLLDRKVIKNENKNLIENTFTLLLFREVVSLILKQVLIFFFF